MLSITIERTRWELCDALYVLIHFALVTLSILLTYT